MDSKEFAFALNSEENFESSFDFDELEEKLQSQLKLELSELEILKENQKQIGDPDNLGKVVEDVIWEQVNNQIAIVAGEDFIKENGGMTLDLRNEAHIQTTENFAKGKIAKHNTKINYQERYDNWQSNFKKDENGNIIYHTTRSGKEEATLVDGARKPFDKDRPTGSAENKTDMDHILPAAKIIRDPAANAHLTQEEQIRFANSDENLCEMNLSQNRSKGQKTISEWLDNPNAKGQKPKDIFNITDEEEKRMRQNEEKADKEYKKTIDEGEQKSIETGKQSQKEEAFRMGGKALRAVVMQLIASFVKEVIAKLIKWFKTTKGKFEMLLDSLKEAIHSFVGKLKTHLINAGSTLFNNIATAIVGPVFRTLKQVWMLLKQGWKSIKEAIDYMKNPENKNQPLGRLILEISKIMTVGLTAAGAILLGEAIEKGLSSIPILLVEIPLLGSLANIIGIFMGAVVSGIIGAIAINLIQKMIKNKYETQIVDEKIDKSNEILRIQHKIINLNEDRVVETKERIVTNIKERHKNASDYIKDTFNKVFGEKNSTQEKMDEIDSLLEELMR
ncbi:cation diffusion facilitator family transporter [Leptotrichia hongkongensis]|uniref:Cation diffusion facilitator family transporter n=1 Tax=Leptotrichia hongkongensis TaxID=554406 RepID=A0ABV4S2Z3_9FUSO